MTEGFMAGFLVSSAVVAVACIVYPPDFKTKTAEISLCPNSIPMLHKARASKDRSDALESMVVYCSDKNDSVMYLSGKFVVTQMPEDDRPTLYVRENK